MRTFDDILSEVTRSCAKNFTNYYSEVQPYIVETATKIYLAEMYLENLKEAELEQRIKTLTERTSYLENTFIGVEGV